MVFNISASNINNNITPAVEGKLATRKDKSTELIFQIKEPEDICSESYTKKKNNNMLTHHEEIVKELADKWCKTYKINSENGEFTKFIKAVYDFAKELKMTKANTKWNASKYPTELDQAVDELLGAFANESKFNPQAKSDNGLYHGIFQFSEEGMRELKQRGTKLKILTMNQFRKLDRVQQLQYMTEYIKICKKHYSKLGNQEISAKQVYAMWQLPSCGNPNNSVQYSKKRYTGNSIQTEKQNTIIRKQEERDSIGGKLVFKELNN